MKRFLISAAILLAAAARLSAQSDTRGGFETYRDKKYGFSFSYPRHFSVKLSTAPGGDLRHIVIINGPCAAGDLRLVRAGKAKISLPKRPSFPAYDAKRNLWLETDEETDAVKPVCLTPAALKSGLAAYTHTDAMHGWSSDIILTNKGTAFIWTNTPHSHEAICELESKTLLEISRTLAFSGSMKSIQASCPDDAKFTP